MKHTKVFIIGAGPAGYTAAIYAARANLSPIQALGLQPGGQLTITTDVENYPGFSKTVQGPWLMEEMRQQAEHVGTEMIYDVVAHVDFSARPFVMTMDGGEKISADTVIIATGAQAKWLNIPSEDEFKGYGVSACATCDGFFYKNKRVAVVGGGNTAVEEAIYLTNHASEVFLIHRRDSLKAEKIAQDRLMKNPKINIIWDSVVDEILGTDSPKSMNALSLKNIKTSELSTLTVDGLFVAIGHHPMSEIFKGQINLDDEGYIIVDRGTTKTNIPGVFAAGDVSDKIYRQAVTAAGMGCMAALDAEKFLNH
jgi:thioredoxin reductase (NADPH)